MKDLKTIPEELADDELSKVSGSACNEVLCPKCSGPMKRIYRRTYQCSLCSYKQAM